MVFDTSGSAGIGITLGHGRLKLIRREPEVRGDGTDEWEAWGDEVIGFT